MVILLNQYNLSSIPTNSPLRLNRIRSWLNFWEIPSPAANDLAFTILSSQYSWSKSENLFSWRCRKFSSFWKESGFHLFCFLFYWKHYKTITDVFRLLNSRFFGKRKMSITISTFSILKILAFIILWKMKKIINNTDKFPWEMSTEKTSLTLNLCAGKFWAVLLLSHCWSKLP